MRMIIAGSRGFSNYGLLKDACLKALKELGDRGANTSRENVEIVSGGARGADRLGEVFAGELGLNLKKFPADWNRFGKGAGILRNEEMARYASETPEGVLVAFWDGVSRGTASMIELARRYGLEVVVVYYCPANTVEGPHV